MDEPYFPLTLWFLGSHIVKRAEELGFAARPTCIHSTLTTLPIHCCLGIISEQEILPAFTELLFPLRNTGLLLLAWFSSFCLEGVGPQGIAWAAGGFDRSIRSILPVSHLCASCLLKARGSLCHTWSREIGDYGLLPGHSWELCWAASWRVIRFLFLWDGNQNAPLQKDSFSHRLPEKAEQSSKGQHVLIIFVCFWCQKNMDGYSLCTLSTVRRAQPVLTC